MASDGGVGIELVGQTYFRGDYFLPLADQDIASRRSAMAA